MPSISKEKYFFYILLALATILCLAILWPFLSVILVSASVAVAVFPVFNWLRHRVTFGRNSVAAFLTILLNVVCVGVPMYFLGVKVFHEAQSLYKTVETGDFGFTLPASVAKYNIQSKIGDLAGVLSTSFAKIFTTTFQSILSLLLVLLSMYYFLKDGEKWKKYVVKVSPLSNEHDERIISMLARAVDGVIRGYVVIAIIQAVLMGLGLQIFGVPNATVWALIAGIVSMVPNIGTAFVSVPAILFLYLTGHQGSAIGLLVWAALVVGSVDNFLNPMIVGHHLELHPIVILFAVIGGLALMGPVGLLIGPLAVSLFYTLTEIYKEDFQSR